MAQAQIVQMQKDLNYQQNPLAKIINDSEKEALSQPNQDFSSNNNAVQKVPKKEMKKKRENNYSTTKVKARNFLTNVSYFRVKDTDLINKSFVVDRYSFIVLNLNPFYLERKFEKTEERQQIEMLWNVLIPCKFFSHICKTDIYNVLISTKLEYQDVLEIVKVFAMIKKITNKCGYI